MKTNAVLLTNFIPPYRIPLFRALRQRLGSLQVLIATPMESNRPWNVSWEDLEVRVQKCLSVKRKWRHPHGFEEEITVHVPYDTLWSLIKLRPTVVITSEMGTRTIQAWLYRLINRRSRMVIWATVSEHSEKGRGRLRAKLRSFLLKRADAVIVNGESGKRYVMRYGVEPKNIFLSPYTTTYSSFFQLEPQMETTERYNLLYVGQLIERKGLREFMLVLIRYANIHPEKNISLKLVGDGPLRYEFAQWRFPENLDVAITGNLQYQDIPAHYANSDIFVFPTLADEWGLVVNEAMAAGVPVLGSIYSQAVEELVVDGENGWTFSPQDEVAMGNALAIALSLHKTDIKKLGDAARQRIQQLTPDFAATKMAEACAYVQNRFASP